MAAVFSTATVLAAVAAVGFGGALVGWRVVPFVLVGWWVVPFVSVGAADVCCVVLSAVAVLAAAAVVTAVVAASVVATRVDFAAEPVTTCALTHGANLPSAKSATAAFKLCIHV